MLDRLEIKDFQVHKHFKLALSQIVCIVGPSDKGKSAILRAIRWLMTNRPSGDAFMHYGADLTSVRARVDGSTITRTKGKQNLYKLKGKEFKAFGTDVPSEIADLLNVSDINFQWQHDSSFWFHMTPGEVAKALNNVVDLSIIDRSQTYVAKTLRKANSVVEVAKDRLNAAKTELAELDYVPNLIKAANWLNQLNIDLEEKSKQCDDLSDQINVIADLDQKINTYDQLTNNWQIVADCHSKIIELFEQFRSLNRLYDQIKIAQLTIDLPVPNIIELNLMWQNHDNLVHNHDNLADLIKTIEKQQNSISEIKENLNNIEFQLISETKGLCPICGGKLNENITTT